MTKETPRKMKLKVSLGSEGGRPN